jgi:hypothetical protein
VKTREGDEKSTLATPPGREVEWCFRTWVGDTLFARGATAYRAAASIGLGLGVCRWVKRMPDDFT